MMTTMVENALAEPLQDNEVEQGEVAAEALAWQREQVLESWRKLKAGEAVEVSKEEIDAEFRSALEQASR